MTTKVGMIPVTWTKRSRQYLCLRTIKAPPTVGSWNLKTKSSFSWNPTKLLNLQAKWTKSLLHVSIVVVLTTLVIVWNSPEQLLRTTHPRVPTKREISGTLSNPSQTLTVIHTTPLGKITQTLGWNKIKPILPIWLIVTNQTVHPPTVLSTTILLITMVVPIILKDWCPSLWHLKKLA